MEMKRTLRQLNAFNEQDINDFRSDKLLTGVYHGIQDYKKYLRSAKEVIQNQNAIAIPVRLETIKVEDEIVLWRYYLLSTDKIGEKKATIITNYLFKNEQETVYSKKPAGNYKLDKEYEILISNRNEEELYLDFDFDPSIGKTIFLKANDYQIKMQEKVLHTLNNRPENHHVPLLRLFDLPINSKSFFEENYNDSEAQHINFKILNDLGIDGTKEQQEFVKKALSTKDFALLEGPPGSGKTTAIIELIIQCVLKGQRVLLVSSTHVAVDNVIDRIVGKFKEHTEGFISPMRIASNIGVIRKERVESYRMQSLIAHTKKEMLNNLSEKPNSSGVKSLKKSLNSNNESGSFNQIILNAANLVGGTAIGILQHPDIKSGVGKPFDVMIVDEASKVTFLDFLVPALHAKKWILVGDVNQLSPYTENDIVTEHLNKLLAEEQQELLAEAFELRKSLQFYNKEKIVHVLYTTNDQGQYDNFKNSDFEVFHLDSQKSYVSEISRSWQLNSADLIICKTTKENSSLLAQYLKFKAKFYGDIPKKASFIHHQNHYHRSTHRRETNIKNYFFKLDTDENWGVLVGSRLEQMYQYRFKPKLNERIKYELDILVPNSIEKQVEGLRRVALPSILELLQIGIGGKQHTTKEGKTYNVEKILYAGFNDMGKVKALKFESLSYQHRMQEEIAQFSRTHFYNNDNLKTANTVLERSNPLQKYKNGEDAIIWVSNNYDNFKNRIKDKKRIINPDEVRDIKAELESFLAFAKTGTQQEYEVAVLTFYKDQEIELKEMLRKLTNQHHQNEFFKLANIKITLCTIDKFQGDEADMVLLSFAKASKGAFYNSPNRLNVALTRARYKLILYGNPALLKKKAGLPALQKMASDIKSRLTSKKNSN